LNQAAKGRQRNCRGTNGNDQKVACRRGGNSNFLGLKNRRTGEVCERERGGLKKMRRFGIGKNLIGE